MKKSFMTRVLAVSLSAAMAFSMSSAGNLMTASAASTVSLNTTFKTLKVKQTYQLKLKNNTLGWKITKVTTSNKAICTIYNKKASSVMLKGKGVGRAKIRVKVKTAKRKYPKNIKYMTCTANVKAADPGTDTPVADALSATATPISTTQVRVTFNKAVDDASDASKFTISGGVTVTKSDPSEDKLSTVLTFEGAEAEKSYDLTVKGMTVNGAAQADLTLKFTTLSSQTVDTGYKMIITPEKNIVKSDGQTQTRVTFEIQKDGKTVTDQTAQIEFSVSRGKFADTRATLKDGKVEVMYSAPQETVSVPAVIQATVVESSDSKMIGTQGVGNITLSPNPDNLTSEAAIITSAAAGTADRVIAYFDKDVNAADFMKDGRPDKTKFDCVIKTGLDSAFAASTGEERQVIAILPVANESKALEILVDKPLRDNANASVKFKDKRVKTSSIDTTNTVNFRLADAREPSVLSVESSGTREIEITFSEAVLPNELVTGGSGFSANRIENYLIDGRPLSQFGIKKVKRDGEIADISSSEVERTEKDFNSDETFSAEDGEVKLQSYTVKDKVGTDNRHKVTITVGSGSVLSTGTHMLTVKNVGDWAASTDAARNSVNTQVLPFVVTENADKPEFTVNIQSPEQYELNFNTAFKVVDNADGFWFKTADSSLKGSVLELQEYVNGAWTTISNNGSAMTTRGQNPVAVSRVGGDDKKYLVEVKRDWSDVYDYNNTRTDYYNKRLRLHVAAGKLVNVSNNLRNEEINIELNASDARVTNGNIMGEADLTSPKIAGITQAVAKNGTSLHSWNVEFTEPVKISSNANQEGLTPSQKQQDGVSYTGETKLKENQGVPVPFARFVNVDNPSTIIEGNIDEDKFIDAEDKVIHVEPERKLSGGEWRLVVGSISDDYGSTLATDGQVITVDENVASTDFKIVWAAVSQDKKYNEAKMGNTDTALGEQRGSYVFVKFNKAVDLATALNEDNYALNNQPLPHGSNIFANIEDYDDHDGVVDSVTIALPVGSTYLYSNYNVSTISTQLSINGVVAQGTGEALSGSGMTQVPYNIGEYASKSTNYSTSNGVKLYKTNVTEETDAVWGNHATEKKERYNTWSEYYNALRAALDDDQYRKVKIEKEAFDNLQVDDANTPEKNEQLKAAQAVFGKNLIININRAVDVDFGDATIYGNIVVSTTDAVDQMMISKVTIKGSQSKVRGNNASLTVNAGVVRDFIFDGTAEAGQNDNAILLSNVWVNSFKLPTTATVNGTIYVTDTDGFGFDNESSWGENGESLIINSNGIINLKGKLDGANITVEQAATLNLGTLPTDDKYYKTGSFNGTHITLKAAETKVKITDASVANSNTKPEILVIGKDVKVYLPDSSKNDWLKSAGGNVIEIDEKGRTITSSNLNSTVQNTVGGMKKILDELEIIPGVAENSITYTNYKTVTSGAINSTVDSFVATANGKVAINRSNMAKNIASLVVDQAQSVELKKANGEYIKVEDVGVSVSLADISSAKIFSQTNTLISPKAVEGSNVTDTIVITLTYAGNTYTRNIKITN